VSLAFEGDAVFQMLLPEGASDRIESLLSQVCPVHPGTTRDGGECAICDLEGRLMADPVARPLPMAAESEVAYR
jgi:hypothetical protein